MMVLEIQVISLLVVFAIFLFAGMVKGVLGFGLPIISMSILPFFMPIEKAIVLSAIVQPATNIFQLVTAGRIKESAKLAWPVLATLIPGVALGAWYLTSLESGTLIFLVGLTIIVFSLLDFLGYRVPIPEAKRIPIGIGVGFVAGVFGALTALNGWVFILYLLGLGTDRQAFRSTIALLFLISGFLISSSFWLLGWLNAETMILGVLALAGAFPGMWIGDWFGRRLSVEKFRRVILLALACIGCVLIGQGLA